MRLFDLCFLTIITEEGRLIIYNHSVILQNNDEQLSEKQSESKKKIQ